MSIVNIKQMPNLQVFGALMRPLELVPVEDMDGNEKRKPLLQRMAEEKRCESSQ